MQSASVAYTRSDVISKPGNQEGKQPLRMSFRDKGVRKACWESRDRYWACLDLPGIQRDHCLELRRLYELACPGHWVKHFDRKRQYMEFQERIHSVGLREPATLSSCPALDTSLSRRHRVYSEVVFT